MRVLSAQFMDALANPAGVLHPILARVKMDNTLMLAIRANYINIYYRGGNLLRVAEHNRGAYRAFFDQHYNRTGHASPDLPVVIASVDDARKWVDAFPILKNFMDEYLYTYSKPEREAQQLVARENNYSSISNESEYFVSDIEFADSNLGARFDILAIRWRATQRTNGSSCRVALFEMKYGDDALGGTAGLIKHLQDIDALIGEPARYAKLLLTMEGQFNQLDQLGLLNFTRSKRGTTVKLDVNEKPEVVFILANHNPRSTKLRTLLSLPEMDAYAESQRFDLRFYVARFAGYGLHAKCMLSLSEFRQLV